jgi:hypothetical protein
LIASTAIDANWILVNIVSSGVNSNTNGLLDVLIGAATEAVLISDLPVTSRGAAEGGGGPYLFPVFIPKGSRLAAMYQNNAGDTTADITVQLFSGNPQSPWAGCSYVDRYGVTASSRGTNVDPGGVADTYVGNVEITASTTRDYRWLVLTMQNSDNNFAAAARWTIQLDIGAATEASLAGDFMLSAGTTGDRSMPFMHYYLPIFVPRSSRLSVDAKCTSITDGDRDLYISIYGAG